MKKIVPHGGFLSHATQMALAAASLVLLGFAVATFASPPPPPDSDGRVSHTVSGNTETWRIDEPNVKKKIIEFPEIRFQPGDQVRVTGGGCVQTGGWGKTWKRYVDPLGPNSDRLYHGMVLIPGAIGELPADDLDRFARILIVKRDHLHRQTHQGAEEAAPLAGLRRRRTTATTGTTPRMRARKASAGSGTHGSSMRSSS